MRDQIYNHCRHCEGFGCNSAHTVACAECEPGRDGAAIAVETVDIIEAMKATLRGIDEYGALMKVRGVNVQPLVDLIGDLLEVLDPPPKTPTFLDKIVTEADGDLTEGEVDFVLTAVAKAIKEMKVPYFTTGPHTPEVGYSTALVDLLLLVEAR
jgi:hypothetical protein